MMTNFSVQASVADFYVSQRLLKEAGGKALPQVGGASTIPDYCCVCVAPSSWRVRGLSTLALQASACACTFAFTPAPAPAAARRRPRRTRST